MARAIDPDSKPRSSWPVVLAAVLGFLVGDSARPVSEQLGARAAIAAVDVYRATASPVLARTGLARCKFEPTCSAYAREALARHGLAEGSWLTARRLVRCNPWAKGGFDGVP